ncbi:DNA translocase FtsK [Bacillus sp. DNRA2]|uniref:FtsK/SpoIIIE family DNA translocase n=1 Tax=Bacillus sp. DNRA2 TaxID=2723053 RepID=UPI00145CFB90|nr:DNA translocase FtsK [Bacillus sp. DNRA2]NMD69535.1 DNA translocase FtsK [Bacillus sp. DNRA2]
MAKTKRRTKKKVEIKKTLKYELIGIVIIALSLITMAKLGKAGAAFVLFFRFFMGEWYIVSVLGLLAFSLYMMIKRELPNLLHIKLIGAYLVVAAILLFDHINFIEILSKSGQFKNPSVIMKTFDIWWNGEVQNQTSTRELGGGMIGAILFALFNFLFAETGTKIVAFVLIIIGVTLITGKSLSTALGKVFVRMGQFAQDQWQAFVSDMKEWGETRKQKQIEKKAEQKESRATRSKKKAKESEDKEVVPIVGQAAPIDEVVPTPEPIISSFAERAYPVNEVVQPVVEPVKAGKTSSAKGTGEKVAVDHEEVVPNISFAEVENVSYELPPLDLLNFPRHTDQSGEYELIHANAAKLERTFHSFGVKARVTQVHLGPAVTKYEVHPDVGVKVSKIVSLSDDLALALAAKDIRIEAPIPGKSAIGIEVPNSEVAIVSLREVLESKQNNRPDAKLLIGLGRDITGEAKLAELNKMPHLLVAGSTGSGKSVCINGIITSILMRAKPHEVKMMMIDPKMVELNVYNGIPHLLAPVVTDAKKASQALKKVVSEMERRYELFSHTGTRNIEGYNEHVKRHNAEEEAQQPLLPYIVVIVDELADLMMVASSDVEDSITRLAQMARAAGIHLIIATQRPSVDVITGVIKANIPSRIAFAVSSATDSRTILDMGGAEKLLGRGDMLFLPVGASKPVRVQGAFLSDQEVEDVVDFVITQQKAQYQEEMIPDDIPSNFSEVDDDLYDDAVQMIVEMQTASVSMLQRRFRIGYTRAARLIDEMELRGVVGPYEGSKPRTVLIGKNKEDIDKEA